MVEIEYVFSRVCISSSQRCCAGMLMPADPCTAWLDSLMWASQVVLMLVMAMVMAMVIIPIMRMIIAAIMVIVSMFLVQLGHSYTFSKLAIKFCL